MSSDNYAYDFYKWGQEVMCAENVSNKTITNSIQYGIKSMVKREKKIANYSQEYPDSESNASITTYNSDDLYYHMVINNMYNRINNTNKKFNKNNKNASRWCCFHFKFLAKKKYQDTL
jgi:hypothetical protein